MEHTLFAFGFYPARERHRFVEKVYVYPDQQEDWFLMTSIDADAIKNRASDWILSRSRDSLGFALSRLPEEFRVFPHMEN